jgi:hypothetical protein
MAGFEVQATSEITAIRIVSFFIEYHFNVEPARRQTVLKKSHFCYYRFAAHRKLVFQSTFVDAPFYFFQV